MSRAEQLARVLEGVGTYVGGCDPQVAALLREQHAALVAAREALADIVDHDGGASGERARAALARIEEAIK